MEINIQLFAFLKEALGESITLDVPPPVTAGGVRSAFLNRNPRFEPAGHSLCVAVNLEYVPDDHPVLPGQEVAIFPPVSGG
ncbi:MAG: MoaD/ThiS family protein [Deltaproteobacteria bacterium]|nr:MoaD/ThiS family protein [Deltaproteobacteria bacterium]